MSPCSSGAAFRGKLNHSGEGPGVCDLLHSATTGRAETALEPNRPTLGTALSVLLRRTETVTTRRGTV